MATRAGAGGSSLRLGNTWSASPGATWYLDTPATPRHHFAVGCRQPRLLPRRHPSTCPTAEFRHGPRRASILLDHHASLQFRSHAALHPIQLPWRHAVRLRHRDHCLNALRRPRAMAARRGMLGGVRSAYGGDRTPACRCTPDRHCSDQARDTSRRCAMERAAASRLHADRSSRDCGALPRPMDPVELKCPGHGAFGIVPQGRRAAG